MKNTTTHRHREHDALPGLPGADDARAGALPVLLVALQND